MEGVVEDLQRDILLPWGVPQSEALASVVPGAGRTCTLTPINIDLDHV